MQKPILVTGGVGYVGSHTVLYYLQKGKQVVVFDNLTQGHKSFVNFFKTNFSESFTFEEGDIRELETVKALFDKYEFGGIIDFAAKSIVPHSQEEVDDYFENNVEGFLNIVKCAHTHNNIPIIKSSTAAAYGSPPEDKIPLKEKYTAERKFEKEQLEGAKKDLSYITSRWNKLINSKPFVEYADILKLNQEEIYKLNIPVNVYGITKVLDEIILKKFKKNFDLPSVALRYFNAAGASETSEIGEDHNPETHIIPIIIKQALEKVDTFVFRGNDFNTKDGSGVRDYVHVTDLARAHMSALEKIDEVSDKYDCINLGSGVGYSVWEILRRIEKVSGHNFKFEYQPRRPGDPDILIADASRAEEVLGWKPKYNLDDIIEHAWNWHSGKS